MKAVLVTCLMGNQDSVGNCARVYPCYILVKSLTASCQGPNILNEAELNINGKSEMFLRARPHSLKIPTCENISSFERREPETRMPLKGVLA